MRVLVNFVSFDVTPLFVNLLAYYINAQSFLLSCDGCDHI